MQVSVEATSTLERKLTVGVPAERVDAAVEARLIEAAKTLSIKGFRPGKVPLKVVRQRYGQGLRQEVLGDVLNQTFQEAVRQQNLKPAGSPSIEAKSMAPGKDVEYVATFEIFPELSLQDYSDIAVVKPVVEITDHDIDTVIDSLRMQAASWELVERPAQSGDLINLDYVGTKGGENFEGGSYFGSDMILGSGRMIPGFEAGIIGMKASDQKNLDLTFPEDYHSEALKGAAVTFAIKLHSVKERTPAAIGEAFFKRFGVTEGGEAQFRKEVVENMQREMKSAMHNRVKSQVMEALLAHHDGLEVPKALIKNEIPVLREQAVQRFGQSIAMQSMNAEELLPDSIFEEQAKRRVQLGTIMNQIIAERSISADPEKVGQAVNEIAASYDNPTEVVNWYYGNRQNLQGVEAMVLEDAVVELLVAGGKVSEEKMTYTELMAPPKAAASESETEGAN